MSTIGVRLVSTFNSFLLNNCVNVDQVRYNLVSSNYSYPMALYGIIWYPQTLLIRWHCHPTNMATYYGNRT